ncbi:Uncharacterized protein yfdK [Beauveria bassiana D1-5]|uniref:Uncharacterized protein yfdK n=1 Tax=Beauveria bassiana D1-5 TaxID=1245745 RepID=A0A0A2V4M0_BEABA|nr:Uncharacterized protein yfdK [Beauveria bassiana D1-5]
MTSYYYSAKKNVFIAAGSTLLETDAFTDAVPVSNKIFAEFFIGENDGKRRVPGTDGLPSWEEIPPPTEDELHAIAVQEAENKKAQLLAESAEAVREWQTDLLLGIISDQDKARFIGWRSYAKKLKAVDTSTAPDVTWPDKPAV